MTDVIDEVDAETWNDLLERGRQATPFHLAACLECCAAESGARLKRYVGYKGQQPTGLFPVFGVGRRPLTAAFSPPPGVEIPYLGPVVLAPDGLKQRKRERWNRSFLESVFEQVAEELAPSYWEVHTSPKFDDERPFLWNGHEATLQHTHVVSLPDSERALQERLDAAPRHEDAREQVEIQRGGPREIEPVVRLVAERYSERGNRLGLEADLLERLHRQLPDGTLRVYTCRREGRLLGGDLTLEFGDTVYGWLGGAARGTELPVNALLYDHLLRDACRRGYREYDLVGTDDRRLAGEATFDPELRGYAVLVRQTAAGRLARRLYRLTG